MKRAIRRMGVIGVFAGMLAGMVLGMGFMVRDAGAHTVVEERLHHFVYKKSSLPNIQARHAPGMSHNAIVVSWDAVKRSGYGIGGTGEQPITSNSYDYDGEYHRGRAWPWVTGYWVTLSTTRYASPRCFYRQFPTPVNCYRRDVAPGSASYSETFTGLSPETTYYIDVAPTFQNPRYDGGPRYTFVADYPRYIVALGGRRATITTTVAGETPDPDTSDPETENPDPSTPEPDCTYEHRLIGVPGTTRAGYTSQILISSKDSKATVKLRAYQAFNGAPIDVLNSDDQAVGSTTSLSPANSVKQFKLEGITGWHIVIVEHPSKAAMDNATVAMRIREPDSGVSIELAERIEQCTNTATTTE